MPSINQLSQSIATFIFASDKAFKFINGTDTETVTTESGTYPTFAKAIKDFQDEANSQIEDLVEEAVGNGLEPIIEEIVSENIGDYVEEAIGEIVVDNLSTNDPTKALSAKQGKVLNDGKVDKVSGKGLSKNDFTDANLSKLNGIATGATANDTDSNLKNRANHTGTQSADTLVNGTANKVFSAADKIKLDLIENGATANSSDDYLLDRSNHTGTQSIGSIEGLSVELNGKSPLYHEQEISTIVNLQSVLNNKVDIAVSVDGVPVAAVPESIQIYGDLSYNGTSYTVEEMFPSGTSNGKTRYANAPEDQSISWNGSEWVFLNGRVSGNDLYINDLDTTYPPISGWSVWDFNASGALFLDVTYAGGINPVPGQLVENASNDGEIIYFKLLSDGYAAVPTLNEDGKISSDKLDLSGGVNMSSPTFTGAMTVNGTATFTNAGSSGTVSITNTQDGGGSGLTLGAGAGFILQTAPQPFMFGSSDGWATSGGAVRKMVETRVRKALQFSTAPTGDLTTYWESFWLSGSRPNMPNDFNAWGRYFQYGEMNGKPTYAWGEAFPGTPYSLIYWSAENSAWELSQVSNSRIWRKVGGTGNLDNSGTWTLVSGGTAPGFERPQIYFETLTEGQMLEVADELDTISFMGFAGTIVRVPRLNFDGELPISGIKMREVSASQIDTDLPAAREAVVLPDFSNCICIGDGINVVADLPWKGTQTIELSTEEEINDLETDNLINGNSEKVVIRIVGDVTPFENDRYFGHYSKTPQTFVMTCSAAQSGRVIVIPSIFNGGPGGAVLLDHTGTYLGEIFIMENEGDFIIVEMSKDARIVLAYKGAFGSI